MTSAADLFGLQEIDVSRDNRRALIADIDSRLGEPEELVGARERVTTAEAELEARRREQRELETRVQDLDAKIGPLDKKLYGGTIRNPKELTDLQHEVEFFKGQRSKLDDLGLALLERVDAASHALREAKEHLATLAEEWRADLVDLQASRERAEKELSRLNEERQRRTAGMDTAALGVYEALRPKKQGRAVARIEQGNCQGCRVMLPSHIVQKARSAVALVQCPRCERILVGG